MKKISLSILIATLVFSLGAGRAFATALATTASALGTGTVTLDNGSLSGQTAAITFTTSVNVYVTATGSAVTDAQSYVTTAGHLNGDKEYGLASSGGGVRWLAKTAGSSTLTGVSAISSAGSVTWGSFATMD